MPATARRRSLQIVLWRGRLRQEGMPVQIDGSQHPWLVDRGPTLALLIVAEDVTGTAAQTVLRAGKNSLGYLMLLEGWPAGGQFQPYHPSLPPLSAGNHRQGRRPVA